jgi:hypothetical protein
MIRGNFLLSGRTYVIDHITGICKTEHYEGKMKTIHNFHGKSRTIMLITSTRIE